MKAIEDGWDSIKEELEEELDETIYETWVEPMRFAGLKDGTVEIAIPEEQAFAKEYLVENFADRIANGFREMFGFPFKVELVCEDNECKAAATAIKY